MVVGVGDRSISLDTLHGFALPVAGEVDPRLVQATLLDKGTPQVTDHGLLPCPPGEALPVLPVGGSDSVGQKGGRLGGDSVARQPGDFHVRQLAQVVDVGILCDLEENLSPGVLREILEEAGDRGRGGVVTGDEQPVRTLRQIPGGRGADDVDPLAGLGAVRPGGRRAQAVLDEVDVNFTGDRIPATHRVRLPERTPLLGEPDTALLADRQDRLSLPGVGEGQLDVVIEAGGGELPLVETLRGRQRTELVAGEGDATKARSDVRDPLHLEFPHSDGVDGGRAGTTGHKGLLNGGRG